MARVATCALQEREAMLYVSLEPIGCKSVKTKLCVKGKKDEKV